MAKGYFLSEDDMAVMRDLLQWWRQAPQSLRGLRGRVRTDLEPDPQAPEVYVARIPSEGIPALDLGTDTGTGTGTTETGDDILSWADCPLFRRTPGTTFLEPVFGITRRVYNLSGLAIPGGQWCPVVRDKFGDWYAVAPGSSLLSEGGGNGSGSLPAMDGAYVYHVAASTTVAASATQALPFDSEKWDTGGYHSTTVNNSRLTIPSSGFYLVGYNGTVLYTSDTGGGTIWVRVNGTEAFAVTDWKREDNLGASYVANKRFLGCQLVQLFAADYLELTVDNDDITNSATFTVTAEPTAFGGRSFWIKRVADPL